jgi:hypothetical protein
MPQVGDYSLGKIYKLVSNETDDIYIGSTCQRLLCMRFGDHKKNYRQWLEGKNHYRTSYEIVKQDSCQITLIENYPCKDKYELESRERYHIENTSCVNKYIPTRTHKEYHEQHKSIRNERSRQHRKENQDYYKECDKNRYTGERKEKLLYWSRQRIICECGNEISQGQLVKHLRTNKHKQLLEQKAVSEPDPELEYD